MRATQLIMQTDTKTNDCEMFAPSAKSPIKLICAIVQLRKVINCNVPMMSLKVQCASIVHNGGSSVVRFAKFDVSISLFHEHLHGLEWIAVVADLSATTLVSEPDPSQ